MQNSRQLLCKFGLGDWFWRNRINWPMWHKSIQCVMNQAYCVFDVDPWPPL